MNKMYSVVRKLGRHMVIIIMTVVTVTILLRTMCNEMTVSYY